MMYHSIITFIQFGHQINSEIVKMSVKLLAVKACNLR